MKNLLRTFLMGILALGCGSSLEESDELATLEQPTFSPGDGVSMLGGQFISSTMSACAQTSTGTCYLPAPTNPQFPVDAQTYVRDISSAHWLSVKNAWTAFSTMPQNVVDGAYNSAINVVESNNGPFSLSFPTSSSDGFDVLLQVDNTLSGPASTSNPLNLLSVIKVTCFSASAPLVESPADGATYRFCNQYVINVDVDTIGPWITATTSSSVAELLQLRNVMAYILYQPHGLPPNLGDNNALSRNLVISVQGRPLLASDACKVQGFSYNEQATINTLFGANNTNCAP